LGRLLERGRVLLAFGVVVDQISDAQHVAIGARHELEAGGGICALALAHLLEDVRDLSDLVLRTLTRNDRGDVDDRLLVGIERLQAFTAV
jgi:hypothetical protein